MRDGDDEDVIGFNGVEHGVREYPRSAEVYILFNNAPTVRRSDNPRDCGSDFLSEPLAESTAASFVELDGFLEFQKRFGMELVPHFASRRSMRR